MSDAPAPEPAITARAIMVSGPSGPVFGPADLVIRTGGLTVLVCPAGVGRAALLLTLAGRMRPTTGSLAVFGRTRIDDIFALAAPAAIDGVDDLAESATVGDLITEKMRWDAPWYRLIRRADDDALAGVCGPVFGGLAFPSLSETVEELGELDAMLLRIALANTRRPPLLVVGDIEQVTSDRDRELLLDRLAALGAGQTVVTASANGVTGGLVADVVVENVVVENVVVENASRTEPAGQQEGGA